MSFSIGIVGLPNVGKSTLFKALTKQKVEIAAYPFTTIHPNIGIVAVPDKRLKRISNIIKPEKTTPTTIKFVDIAGLVKGANKGEGLGNQFLSHIKNCNAIIEVIRAFENQKVEHIEKTLNPQKDIETIKTELLMKDLETLEKIISKAEKDVKIKDRKTIKRFDFLKNIKEKISQGEEIRELNLSNEEKNELKEYQFLTEKPIIYLLNINSRFSIPRLNFKHLKIDLKLEEEISGLSLSEMKEFEVKSQVDEIIAACYNILDLITFYTIAGGKEVRAWTLKKGEKAPRAGGKVHSDFEEKFIRAEIIPWQELVAVSKEASASTRRRGESLAPERREIGYWNKAKETGMIKIVGHDYIVKDGDVIEFKI